MEKSFEINQLDETSWVILEFTDEDDSFRVISYHESEAEAQNALG